MLAAGDPEARVAVPVDDRLLSIGWTLAHMTSETARHAGHADILCEQIDGTTGCCREHAPHVARFISVMPR